MRFWVIQMGEMLAGIDGQVRDYRYMLLAKRLAANGHEVVRWSSTFEHLNKKFRFNESRTLHPQPGLTLRLLHGLPAYYRNISLARLRQQRHVAQLFEAEADSWPKPDLIYTGIPVPEWSDKAVAYGLRHDVPVVVDAQDPWPDKYLDAAPTWAKPLFRLLLFTEYQRARRIFQNAHAITAVSQTYLDWALALAGRPKTPKDGIYPLGFTPPDTAPSAEAIRNLRLKWRIPENAFVVAFAGSFGDSYDILAMVQAAQKLHTRQHRDIFMVVAGDGDKMAKARQIGGSLPNLVLPGWEDHGGVLALYASANAAICGYSNSATQSIPYKPLEYMAAGLPMISSLPGEFRSIMESENIGRYYTPGDADSLVEQILWLAGHREEALAMGRRSQELFSRRFHSQQIYPALATQLEMLVASSTAKKPLHDLANTA